jgi:hypothetical protein
MFGYLPDFCKTFPDRIHDAARIFNIGVVQYDGKFFTTITANIIGFA